MADKIAEYEKNRKIRLDAEIKTFNLAEFLSMPIQSIRNNFVNPSVMVTLRNFLDFLLINHIEFDLRRIGSDKFIMIYDNLLIYLKVFEGMVRMSYKSGHFMIFEEIGIRKRRRSKFNIEKMNKFFSNIRNARYEDFSSIFTKKREMNLNYRMEGYGFVLTHHVSVDGSDHLVRIAGHMNESDAEKILGSIKDTDAFRKYMTLSVLKELRNGFDRSKN